MANETDLQCWLERGRAELERIDRDGGPPAFQRPAYEQYRSIIKHAELAVYTDGQVGQWGLLALAAAWLWRVRWAVLGLGAIGVGVWKTSGNLVSSANQVVKDTGEVIRALLWAGGAIAVWWIADNALGRPKKPRRPYDYDDEGY